SFCAVCRERESSFIPRFSSHGGGQCQDGTDVEAQRQDATAVTAAAAANAVKTVLDAMSTMHPAEGASQSTDVWAKYTVDAAAPLESALAAGDKDAVKLPMAPVMVGNAMPSSFVTAALSANTKSVALAAVV
ncbi:unnamed protein product, partial [Urochloa humidicola]